MYPLRSRGDRRRAISLDDVDRQDSRKTLAEACQKAGFQVQAYCRTRNHFHWVVETPHGILVAGMRWLLSSYTNRLNQRHKLVRPVFRGRYQALLIEGSGNGYPVSLAAAAESGAQREGVKGRGFLMSGRLLPAAGVLLNKAMEAAAWRRVAEAALAVEQSRLKRKDSASARRYA